MTTNYTFSRSPRSQSGFTLIEIMVGLAIGMLATVVILQVLSVFETQKRTTTGTADAQTNGSIALYNITRDLQVAGYPLIPTSGSPLNCTALNIISPGITDIFPIVITDGTSDAITIRYGTSDMGGIPSNITAGPVGNVVTLDNSFGCRNGDVSLIMDSTGTNCTLSSVSSVPSATTVELDDTTGAVVDSKLACLGVWNEITYQVSNNTLTRQDRAVSATFVPSVPDVVNIQAQYGISAIATSNQITDWVDATPPWAAPTVADRNRIKAVRIAVVARNAKQEVTNVTTGVNAWTGSASFPSPTVDLSVADADWQRYRYRVFETIIPLRNVIWSKGSL